MVRSSGLSQRLAGLVALILLSGFPLAGRSLAAQQQAGIVGQVTDESGAVLPGVTVVASSPVLQVGTVTDVTNERGEYRLSPLPIGTYTVEYTLSGFQAVRREEVRLTVGFVARLDVALNIGAVAETITVRGAAPVVDVTSTGASTRLVREALELIPTSRNGVIALMSQSPGVRSNIDVGGSSIGLPPRYHAFGQDLQGWTQLDGVAMLTAKQGSGGGTVYWDYTTIEEAQIQTLGGDAEVPTRGVQINAVLKGGGNNFHGNGFFGGTGERFESNNLDRVLAAQGIRSGAGIQKRYDVSGDLGGRIVRDKLWFYGNARRRYERYGVVQCLKPDGSQCDAYQSQNLYTVKLSYQANSSNQFNGFFHYGTKDASYGGGAPSRLVAWDARATQVSFGRIGKVGWQGTKGSSLVASVLVGGWTWDGPWQGYTTKPQAIDLVTREVTGVNTSAGRHQFEWRYGPRGTVTWYKPNLFLGNHEFKAGFDWLLGRSDQTYLSTPEDRALRRGAATYQLQFRNGVASQIVIPNYPLYPRSHARYQAIFGQDSWTIARRLTVNLGVRYARDSAFAPEQCRVAADPPADALFPAECFDRIQVKIWNSVAPRLRAAYDVTGDGKTSISGGWGRFPQLRYTEDSQLFNQNAATRITFRWRDLNGNRDYDPGEVNLSTSGPDYVSTSGGADLVNGVQNPNDKQPFSDEYTASFERELIANLSGRLTGAYSKRSDAYRLRNDLRPPEVYTIPITNPDPGPDGTVGTADDTGRFITYYDFPAAYKGAAFEQGMYVNDPAADASFKSVEVAVTKRLSNRWQLLASYTTTWKHIPFVSVVNDASSGNSVSTVNPNAEINTGDFTREWLVRFSGSYSLPWDLLVSSNYENRSGIPYGRTALFRGGAQIPNITLLVEPIGAQRLENIQLIDVTLQKSFSLPRGQRAAVRLNIFNALNNNAVTSLTTQSGANYGRATEILLPRIVELSASYQF